MDIWTFFTCVGIDILRENAILSFIAPNNWVSNAGASKVRNKILRESRICECILLYKADCQSQYQNPL
jgi:adenine-specific DNA-methyltransferase